MQTLHEENNFLLEAGLTNVKDMGTTFASISQMNKHLSRSPSLLTRVMQENQELVKDNMDKHFELERMRRLKRENAALKKLVEEKMETLLTEHQKKLGEFGSKIESYYLETIFYLNKQNLEQEKQVLAGVAENLRAKQERLESQNREVKKKIRNKELECEMIRMDLKRTKQELAGLQSARQERLLETVERLSVSVPEEFVFAERGKDGRRRGARISEEKPGEASVSGETANASPIRTRKARKKGRGRGGVRVSQRKKGKKRRRGNKRKSAEPIEVEDEIFDIFERRGSEQILKAGRAFESMK